MKKSLWAMIQFARFATLSIFLFSTNLLAADQFYLPRSCKSGITITPSNPTICEGQKVKLKVHAPGYGKITWYTVPVGGTPIYQGNVFHTPALNSSVTYYVDASKDSGPRIPITVSVISASAILWNKTFGSFQNDRLRSIAPVQSEGYLFGGGFNNLPTSAISLIKTNLDGNVIWVKPMPLTFPSAEYILPLSSGGYLVGGSVFSASTQNDFGVAKIDEDANVLWVKTYGGSSQDDLRRIIPANDGGFIIAGVSSSSNGDVTDGNNGVNDYWMVKIDAAGNKLWDKSFGGSNSEYLNTISPTADGGYLLGGRSASSDGDVTDGNNGQSDFWIVKTDVAGNKVWDKSFGGNLEDQLNDLMLTSDNGFILAGYSLSSDGDITDAVSGSADGLLFKIDENGNKLWDKTYGSSGPDGFIKIHLANNGFFTTGYTWSSDGDVTDGNNGLNDFWVVKFDNAGNKSFDKTYGSSTEDQFNTSILTPDGSLVLGGETDGDDGDITDGNEGEFDWLVFKVNYSCIEGENTRAATANEGGEINECSIYPNPFTSQLNIRFPEDIPGNIRVEIFDLTGLLIAFFDNINSGVDSESFINTASMKNGVYICKLLVDNKEKQVFRLIKQ